MDWKWVGVDGKGYANTTYIFEFHPHIPAGRDGGMEFGDVDCGRLSSAINSKQFWFIILHIQLESVQTPYNLCFGGAYVT